MASQLSKLQLTLAILKPHVVSNPISLREIRALILENNFKIVQSRREKLSQSTAEKFYIEHREKFFYGRLVTFMTSGVSEFYILTKYNAINDWRKLMGPTKVFKSQFEAPDTIRGRFGLSDTRNATHGSDSEESAAKEIKFFFPRFDVNKWMSNEEIKFRNSDLEFLPDLFLHIPKGS